MKPTKEQLADPKWWGEDVLGYKNYIYWDEEWGFATFSKEPINEVGFELLAKRPEPEQWKPKEGEWCEARTSGKWRKVKTLNVDLGNDLMAFYVPVTENGLSRLIWCDNYRPIKTQREEFIEKCQVVTNANSDDAIAKDLFCDLYDSGLFALTEKDGE